MDVDDTHTTAVSDPAVNLYVDEFADTVHGMFADQNQDSIESDWSTDDEGWVDEVEELKEHSRSR